MRTAYTTEGLQKLGEMIDAARGSMSVRAFARKTGVNYQTINRLLRLEVQEPEISTLEKLAPYLGRDKYQLIAICEGSRKSKQKSQEILIAEDVLPMIDQLPDLEAARVAQAILARLANALASKRLEA